MQLGDRRLSTRALDTFRQIGNGDQFGFDPVGVRAGAGDAGLDLVVADDATFASVDQEHSARLEPALFDDGVLGEIDDADLGSHDDEAVRGDPVATRSEAISVENGAHDGAVGEGDGRGAVPWLHAGGVVLVERLPIGVHLVVVLPRLGDHHQDGLGERVPTEAQQFERLVEAGGVARSRGADRERPLEAGKVWRIE